MHWMRFFGLTLNDAQTVTAVISGFGAVVSLGGAVATAWFAKKNLARELLNQRINVVTTRIKELGYRGYRHEVLDGLVVAYLSLGRMDFRKRDNNKSIRNELTAAKRHFVGQVQKILDPKEMNLIGYIQK